MENWPILGRLRKAVNKVRFLLNFRLHRWISSGALGGSISHRRLSFGDRPGLWLCADEVESGDARSGSYSSPSRRLSLQRTISSPTYSDQYCYDVDKKADMFIANFYRQLQLERQISLELRYCRGNSLGSMKSP
ncbi:uncharacterized protein LOC116193591 [Punica granatum]|uniref:Uncharacterized protein n=2 Tax=Punica granatum TaxID=22663 RepID=A0A218XJ20_PUNGR|nr:uncharacterized protein LOC116193591 [Punica granatum]OWM84342.1 hypothetical protein CDL15_Pgr027112 [Punica granatum]PKI50695.1 hypothetical protein CRG98_028932 [Punica granatum]